MKQITVTLFLFLFVACINDPAEYYQFTSDDLSHLHLNKDMVNYDGVKIEYKDSLAYLLNRNETIYVPIVTEIHSSRDLLVIFNVEDIYGSSMMIFDKEIGFDSVSISISKTKNYWKASKFFQINAHGIYPFTQQYSQTDSVSLDTALVLGKLYQNVYKFYPLSRHKTAIRLIYFAKKYGYIKIEKLDGTKIEKIDADK
jgi:hypothetical protein